MFGAGRGSLLVRVTVGIFGRKMAKPETEISKAIGEQLNQLGVYNLRLNSGKVKVRGGWMLLARKGLLTDWHYWMVVRSS